MAARAVLSHDLEPGARKEEGEMGQGHDFGAEIAARALARSWRETPELRRWVSGSAGGGAIGGSPSWKVAKKKIVHAYVELFFSAAGRVGRRPEFIKPIYTCIFVSVSRTVRTADDHPRQLG